MDVSTDRQHVVINVRVDRLKQRVREIFIPEKFLPLKIVIAPKDMGLCDKLHVGILSKHLLEPVQHELGPVY